MWLKTAVLTRPRYKNFAAGRLTSLSELPREKAGLQEQGSDFGSETDLSKGDNDENSFGGTTVTEVHDELGLEEHGTILAALLTNPH